MLLLLAPAAQDDTLTELLKILLGNFAALLGVVVGTIIFLVIRWRKKFKQKDEENEKLKERERKLAELCNQICYFVDAIASETIKTEPSIVKWATWWSLNYHSLDTNGTTETQEMIKRIISRKDI